VALQLASRNEIVPELVTAVVDTADRHGTPVGTLPGASESTWRVQLTDTVRHACTAALDAGLEGPAAATEAMRRLAAATVPTGNTDEELIAYGALA
jgi:hypothetical protein